MTWLLLGACSWGPTPGTTFALPDEGLDGYAVWANAEGVVLVGGASRAKKAATVLRLDDGAWEENYKGATGQIVALTGAGSSVWAVEQRPRYPETGSEYFLISSDDSGRSWSEAKVLDTGPIYQLLAADSELWGLGHKLWHSPDGGETWSAVEELGRRNPLSDRLVLDPGPMLAGRQTYTLVEGRWVESREAEEVTSRAAGWRASWRRPGAAVAGPDSENWTRLPVDGEPLAVGVNESTVLVLVAPEDAPQEDLQLLYSFDSGDSWHAHAVSGLQMRRAWHLVENRAYVLSRSGRSLVVLKFEP